MDLDDLLHHAESNGLGDNRSIVEIIVYHKQEIENSDAVTAKDVRQAFSDLHLSVPSRVGAYLSEGTQKRFSQYVKSGSGYKLHRKAKLRLGELFDGLHGGKKPQIVYEIVDAKELDVGRKHLNQIIEQINGTYTYRFYDGTAVLMRRLMETLLIEVFIVSDIEYTITGSDGHFLDLSKIIKAAKNPTNIKFSRGIAPIFDAIKDLGDTGAHNRTYITKQTDIDGVQTKFRKIVNELYQKAGLF